MEANGWVEDSSKALSSDDPMGSSICFAVRPQCARMPLSSAGQPFSLDFEPAKKLYLDRECWLFFLLAG